MGPESTNGKIVGVIFFAWFLYSVSLSLSLSLSLALSLSLSLALSLSLSRSLSLINNYIHAYMCLTAGRQSRDHRPLSRDRSVTYFTKFSNCLKHPKTLFDSRPTVAWPRPLSRDRSATFFKIFPNRLKRPKNVVWQSADGRVTSTTVAWPFSDFFQNFPKSLETSKKRCLTVGRRSRDLRPLSRDRSATFFKIFPNRLKRPKNVVWQSADSRVISDHCRVTVQRLFSKFSQIAWNVKKTLFDSRPTVAWPPTTVAWPFSDVFQNFPKSLETSKKRCLTVGRQSRDLRPLSRDRSATFFKIFPNRLKRPKNVVWQSADGRVTSDHCRVTVQRLFSKNFLITWNVQKTMFDSRPTVAWPPTTDAWPFSDFFQNFPKLLETSKKRCLTVSRRSRDLRPLSRDRSATFFKIFPNRLKRPKYVVWQSADGRVTSDHCRVTVQRLFSKKFLIAWNVKKSLFDSRPTVAWPQPLSRDRSATFFKIFPNRLKRPKNVVWQSADGRVTSDHCRVTVQRLFSKFSQIVWNVQKTLFDSRPMVAWPPTTLARHHILLRRCISR